MSGDFAKSKVDGELIMLQAGGKIHGKSESSVQRNGEWEALKNGERREFLGEHCSRKGCAHLWDVDCHQKSPDMGNVALSVWPYLALCDRELCLFDIGTW